VTQRILHITSWFPSKENPAEAIWIKRHIESLDPFFEQDIFHVELKTGKFRLLKSKNENIETYKLSIPANSYQLKEILAFFIIFFKLLRRKTSKYDFINFHIAYPNLVYLSMIRSWFRSRWVITEHWSAYHYHFHSSKKLKRIKAIFKRNIALITVSDRLRRDIENFADTKIAKGITIPNAVDIGIFRFNNSPLQNHFLMASFWKWPKLPFPVFEAISELKSRGVHISVRVIGYGPLMEDMKTKVAELNLNENISFVGYMNAEQIAEEMNVAMVFLLPSEHETFSAITAEALCCGLPVIASDTGALSEIINPSNGIATNNKNWENALSEFLLNNNYNRQAISDSAHARFSMEKVGNLYSGFLKDLHNERD